MRIVRPNRARGKPGGIIRYQVSCTVHSPTFSLMILRLITQRLLNFCSPAAVPTEWKVQLVTVGNTVHSGLGSSVREYCSWLRYFSTWVPYLKSYRDNII